MQKSTVLSTLLCTVGRTDLDRHRPLPAFSPSELPQFFVAYANKGLILFSIGVMTSQLQQIGRLHVESAVPPHPGGDPLD